MEQYIKKSDIVAEINKLKEHFVNKRDDFERGYHSGLNAVSDSLDSLEAKEVDLEQEATEFIQTKEFVESTESPVLLIAKHFFELGLKAQMKTSLREKDDGKNT